MLSLRAINNINTASKFMGMAARGFSEVVRSQICVVVKRITTVGSEMYPEDKIIQNEYKLSLPAGNLNDDFYKIGSEIRNLLQSYTYSELEINKKTNIYFGETGDSIDHNDGF